ncbi:MAG: glycosyl hydrolase [Anaerolineae bacterium]
MKRQPIFVIALCVLVMLSGCGPIYTSRPVAVLTAQPTNLPQVTHTSEAVTPTPTTLASKSETPTGTSTTTATTRSRTAIPSNEPFPMLNVTGKVGFGAYLLDTPHDQFQALRAFELLLSHKMEYALWFQAWGDKDHAFPLEAVKSAKQFGYTPVITWEPWVRRFNETTYLQPAFYLEGIAAGEHDAYLQEWARAAREVAVPLIIRFAHEQSTQPGTISWYPWQGNPDGYRAAFRHIVQVFRQEKANNVKFLWSAMWLDLWAEQYYPGDDVVDYVGTTVLNHGLAPATDWAVWRTFAELTQNQYQAIEKWGKPVILTEVATAEQGGNKAEWLRQAFTTIKDSYPLVVAVLFFEVKADREYPTINWSVESSAVSLAVVTRALQDPYFR